MSVFIRGGGILPTRGDSVFNDASDDSTHMAPTVASGGDGSSTIYEDDNTDSTQSATTDRRYTESDAGQRSLDISPVQGAYDGQPAERACTVTFIDADAPAAVLVDGKIVSDDAYSYDATARTLAVEVSSRSIGQERQVAYSTARTKPIIALSADDPTQLVAGNSAAFTATLPADASGEVTFTSSRGTQRVPLKAGKATVKLALPEGKQTISVAYGGDLAYEPANIS